MIIIVIRVILRNIRNIKAFYEMVRSDYRTTTCHKFDIILPDTKGKYLLVDDSLSYNSANIFNKKAPKCWSTGIYRLKYGDLTIEVHGSTDWSTGTHRLKYRDLPVEVQGSTDWSTGSYRLKYRDLPVEVQGATDWSTGIYRWSTGIYRLKYRELPTEVQGNTDWSSGSYWLKYRNLPIEVQRVWNVNVIPTIAGTTRCQIK
jgi:hypothetical protein